MANKKRVNVPNSEQRGSSAAKPQKKAKLGQNFLNDAGAAQQIVDALGDVRSSTVIEIGPGRGVLTALLAKRTKRLIAIEFDRTLAAQLRMQYATYSNVEIIEGNILGVDLETVIRRRPGALLAGPAITREQAGERAKVVGNIPYYITSDILLRLLEYHELLSVMVLMVQREVADRIAASPGGREYGLLSATAQLFTRAEKLFTLPPGAFDPAPKVHSTVVRLTVSPQAEELGVEADKLIGFLKMAFAHKRKMLAGNLRALYPEKAVIKALSAAKASRQARAETLSLHQMATLYRSLHGA